MRWPRSRTSTPRASWSTRCSRGDLERHRDRAREALAPHRARFALRVHPPESYEHEGATRFLDISSPDADERARSLDALEACARHAADLGADAMIVHPGGLWRGNVGGGPELLRDSLLRSPKHVPVLLENMPYFGPGGDFPAAFRIPSGLRAVDDLVDGYVLDLSHAYLAVPQGSAAVVEAFACGTARYAILGLGLRRGPRAERPRARRSGCGRRARDHRRTQGRRRALRPGARVPALAVSFSPATPTRRRA